MKICGYARVVVIILSLLGFVALSWSAGTETAAKDAQGAVGSDAIVTKIDSGKVTLQSASDISKEITLPIDETAKLKVGDKVKVQGNAISPAATGTGIIDPPEKKTNP